MELAPDTTLALLRWLHMIGATVLLGTGAGIAFFMLRAHRTADPALVAHTADSVVHADWLFTATAVVAQPVTGVLLANAVGWPLDQGWVLVSVVLYGAVGLFWLPVVAIQYRLRRLAGEARDSGAALPRAYHRLFTIWMACGVPAFAAVLAILWLMVAKPAL